MELVLSFYDITLQALEKGASINELVKLSVREKIGRFKYIPAEKMEAEYKVILESLHHEANQLLKKEEA